VAAGPPVLRELGVEVHRIQPRLLDLLGTVGNDMSTDGSCSFDWDGSQLWATPSLTVSLPDR
jgi:hypothetical protein